MAENLVHQLILSIVVVTVVFLLSGFLGRLIQRMDQADKLPKALVWPLQVLAKWGLFVIAFLLVLQNFGLELRGLWGLISTVLALVAIGFVAVWSILSNISSAAVIVLSRPFQIGDTVEFIGEPIKGKVQKLGLLYTTIEEPEGTVIQIPNNIFFQRCLRRSKGDGKTSLLDSLKEDQAGEKGEQEKPS